MKFFNWAISALAGVLIATSVNASACPLIDNLIDFNCNGEIKIAFTGDSIVKGRGDVTDNEGYVGRVRDMFPGASVTNLGVAGITSARLFRSFKHLLSKPGPGRTKLKTEDADVIFIDVGRNDYWGHRSPSLTVRNIRRLVKYLLLNVGTDVQSSPYFVVATQLPTSRGYQAPFIRAVNSGLLKLSSPNFRVGVRFDQINLKYISADGLHPIPAGYSAMARKVARYVKGPLQRIFRGLRPDDDADGVFDIFETLRYGTNPKLADTDGDGFTDGNEIFTSMTDPLVPNP